MNDGVLEGMQSFDYELERLIGAGVVDRETALSYATNRTNLQLRLETQGAGAATWTRSPSRTRSPIPESARRPRRRPRLHRSPSWTT
jgi:hypothetical protein